MENKPKKLAHQPTIFEFWKDGQHFWGILLLAAIIVMGLSLALTNLR